jgi:hypothetical protein
MDLFFLILFLFLCRKVHRNNQVQYEPIAMDPPRAKAILSSKPVGDFLIAAKPRQAIYNKPQKVSHLLLSFPYVVLQ